MAERLLCIGLNYPRTSYSLSKCQYDAERIHKLLSPGSVSLLIRDNISPVGSNEVKNLFRWALSSLPASHANINANEFKKHKHKAPTNVTIFFAGHGMSVRDRSGDERDGRDEVLVTHDGGVLDDDVLKILGEMCTPYTNVRLLFDCCSSGTACDLGFVCRWNVNRIKVDRERNIPMNKRPMGNAFCLSACEDGSYTFENEQGGLFTTSLLTVLKRGVMDINTIVKHLSDRGHNVHLSINKNPMAGRLNLIM